MTLKASIKTILEHQLDGLSIDEAKEWMSDLNSHGCESGMVTDLITYTETAAFYDKHEEEILNVAKECGYEIDIFEYAVAGFKNYTAWFAFEYWAPEVFSANEKNL